VDTTERGDRGRKHRRSGVKQRVTLEITLNVYSMSCLLWHILD
jgi:hypothetical protein